MSTNKYIDEMTTSSFFCNEICKQENEDIYDAFYNVLAVLKIGLGSQLKKNIAEVYFHFVLDIRV